MTFTFRGCGTSTGDFSLQGWVDDLRAAIDHLFRITDIDRVVLVGTNTGGSLAICVGADDPRVARRRALLSPRADFDDWSDHPRRFLDHAREIGAIRTPGFPPSMDDWSRAFRRFRPTAAASRFAPRPMLVMHGEDDDDIPVTDARLLAEAHGSAELSLLPGAGHRLRHDPTGDRDPASAGSTAFERRDASRKADDVHDHVGVGLGVDAQASGCGEFGNDLVGSSIAGYVVEA